MKRYLTFLFILLNSLIVKGQNAIINAAESGDIDAQVWLAKQYMSGENPSYPKNIALAYKWYLAAAKQGNADCQYVLGTKSDFIPIFESQEEADYWCMKAADQGSRTAAWKVGMRLLDNEDPRAFKYFQIAGPVAGIEIAKCYLQGLGTPKNIEKAKEQLQNIINVYKKRIENDGNNSIARPPLIEALNLMSRISLVEDNDEKLAVEYATLAGDYGGSASYRLAGMIYTSVGDKNSALDMFVKAANHGDAKSMAQIGRLAYQDKEYEVSIEWYKKALATDPECSDALTMIGWVYYEQKDYYSAYQYFKKEIEKDLSSGYNHMAYLYANGYVVRQDFNEAHKMVDFAISKVDQGSSSYLNYLDTKGEIYMIAGERNNAKQIWNKILSYNENFADKNTTFVQMIRSLSNESVDLSPNYVVSKANNNTFVVIIANEKYKYEDEVLYAHNDGQTVFEYCSKVLGIPNSNMKMFYDAGYNDIRYAVSWLSKVIKAYREDCRIIFYYAGHGIPDESNKSSYILPVDGFASDIATGYSLSDLFKSLGELPSQSVTIFLDACFSGSKREGNMMASARGVAIKVKPTSPMGNMVVLSASQGDETAYQYQEERHGLFTYFLLKKLKESQGNVSLGELASYIKDNVSKKSIVVNGKSQTPSINPSASLGDSWKNWTLK